MTDPSPAGTVVPVGRRLAAVSLAVITLVAFLPFAVEAAGWAARMPFGAEAMVLIPSLVLLAAAWASWVRPLAGRAWFLGAAGLFLLLAGLADAASNTRSVVVEPRPLLGLGLGVAGAALVLWPVLGRRFAGHGVASVPWLAAGVTVSVVHSTVAMVDTWDNAFGFTVAAIMFAWVAVWGYGLLRPRARPAVVQARVVA